MIPMPLNLFWNGFLGTNTSSVSPKSLVVNGWQPVMAGH